MDWEIQYLKDNNGSMTVSELAEKLGRSYNAVRAQFRKQNIHKIKRVNRRYSVNTKFFLEWSAEMAYVLGYFLADGNISLQNYKTKRNEPCSTRGIRFSSKDLQLLLDVNKVMESTYPITHNSKKEYYTLEINRKVLADHLMDFGIDTPKTFNFEMPNVPENYLSHFIRGYFDGDGYVGLSGNRLRVCFVSANRLFLSQLQKSLTSLGIQTSITGDHYYKLNVLKSGRMRFFNVIYANCSIKLIRKYEIFRKYVEKNVGKI